MNLIGINEDTLTAGPGVRLEVFTKGCARGMTNPCDGCFNPVSWSFSGNSISQTPEDLAALIEKKSWNNLITFCGGEPILQGKMISKAIDLLEEEYHILFYTSYKYESLIKNGLTLKYPIDFNEDMIKSLKEYSTSYKTDKKYITFEIMSSEEIKELFSKVDMIIDGPYMKKYRLTNSDTMHDGWFIGSSNQNVIYGKRSSSLENPIKETAIEYNRQPKGCLVCLNETNDTFCSEECKESYSYHTSKLFD